ncbi:MAG: hypothetical protein A2X94_14710 [Bdellovibrionales bacterium GWB1_55_8]|nr:MAG: hypothetical protein A2X94_14710 [Bdellovibrionales bacterium GWB1_55_8]
MPIFLVSTAFVAAGCKTTGEPSDSPQTGSCFSGTLRTVGGSSGAADVFVPDPMIGAGRPDLAPGSLKMDEYRSRVELSNLGGRGVLEGQYVDVRDELNCKGGFSAFSEKNAFTYAHSDFRFQGAMAYYYGDRYRALLDGAGYLQPLAPVKIVAQCAADNNAYYVRYPGSGGEMTGEVCLGNSTYNRGTSYADDAAVIVHELQHATTVDTYSLRESLNQFWYDEGGALNEGISDFMALMFLAPDVPSSFDQKVFSRWALGTFLPGQKGSRGAHRCAGYDAAYPNCANFPYFSAKSNAVSYVYPDGLGWPHAKNYPGPGYLRSVFLSFRGQEEIHTNGIPISGALWDIYEALAEVHGPSEARTLMTRAVHQALSELPKPTLANRAPVTFRGFAMALLAAASRTGFSTGDLERAEEQLVARGLYGVPTLAAGWGAVGTGDARSPGMKIFDHPTELKIWLAKMGSDPKQVTQTNASLNGMLSGAEVAALWFDIENRAELTAGSVYLRVRSMNPAVMFLDSRTNSGAISDSEAHIVYSKINGTGIVQALFSPDSAFHVPTANSYFRTNPFFDAGFTTALWVRVTADAPAETVVFRVEALPANGSPSVLDFETRIQ